MHVRSLFLIFFTLSIFANYSAFASTESDPENSTDTEENSNKEPNVAKEKSPTVPGSEDSKSPAATEDEEKNPVDSESEDVPNQDFKKSAPILVNSNNQDLQAMLGEATQQCNALKNIQAETVDTALSLLEKTEALLEKLDFVIMELPNGTRHLIKKDEIGNERTPESLHVNFTAEETKAISRAQRNEKD
jgi:hypothetical protein